MSSHKDKLIYIEKLAEVEGGLPARNKHNHRDGEDHFDNYSQKIHLLSDNHDSKIHPASFLVVLLD